MDVAEITRRLAEDSEEVTRSLDLFMSERTSALKQQERALEAYEAELREIGEGSVASSVDESVDHNLMRHLNATRTAALGDNYDEFETARHDLEHTLTAEKRGPKKEKIEFDKGLEPKPEVPDAARKADLREDMFAFLDSAHMEEMRLELEYERIKQEQGMESAEYAADALLSLQKINHKKLLDMFKVYQPQSFGTAWANDPDFQVMAQDLERLIQKIDLESGGEMATLESNAAKKKKKKAVAAKGH